MSRIARRNVVPVNQITPLTYRDGVTYIQMLNELSEYVKSILHPSLQHTVDQLVSDVEKQMDKHHDQYVDGVQEFQRIHDAFMADVNAKLIALNDGAVTDLVKDDTSLLGRVLRSVFTDRESFTDLGTDITNQVNSFIEDAERTFHHDRSPYAFGAVGDGIADDSDAIEAWLQSGAYDFTDGVYRVTRQFEVHQDNFTISGINNPTIILEGSHRFLTIRGHDATVEGFTITGLDPLTNQEHGTGGVYVYGEDTIIREMVVTHIRDEVTARAFHVEGAGGAQIIDNTIMEIRATGITTDTTTGYGMSRAITLHNPDPATKSSIIANNKITGIWGYLGNAISVAFDLGYDGGVTDQGNMNYTPGYTSIKNNVIDGVERRYIKLQASDCEIVGNHLKDTFNRQGDLPGPAIALVRSERVMISDNIIERNNLEIGVSLFSSGIPCANIVVNNNQVYVHGDQIGIFMNWAEYSAVTNNTIMSNQHGQRSVYVEGRHIVISGNVARGSTDHSGSNAVNVYQAPANTEHVYMTNNTDVRYPPAYWQFNNRSKDGITEGNIGLPGGV